MSFMQPEIVETEWTLVETKYETELVTGLGADDAQFSARLASFCGMETELEHGTRADCRAAVASRLRSLRARGFAVTIRESGAAWEIHEPEDVAMVPDACGILSLEFNPSYLRNYVSGDIDSETDPEFGRGFCARLQAPGFLDATEWSCFDTRADALEWLLEFYGSDDPEHAESWESDAQAELDDINAKA